jgi:hypothetical protein
MTIRTERYNPLGEDIKQCAVVEKKDFEHLARSLLELEDYLFFVADFIPHNERAKRMETKAREIRKLLQSVCDADTVRIEGYAKENTTI